MDRWRGKVAVVTGASAGIGNAVCVALANAGLHVVGLARRVALVENLKDAVSGAGSIVGRECDVGDATQLAATFRWLERECGALHVLVNNAGVFCTGQVTDVGPKPLSESELSSTIDVNLKGPILCTKHAVASMKRHGFDGHIITINSIAGHYVPFHDHFNVYPASKHGVTAFLRSLATELGHYNSKIKITSISPGLVATSMGGAVDQSGPAVPILQPADVADAVVYALSTPPHVNINELTITPVSSLRL